MVAITCDVCGSNKPDKLAVGAPEWILGYDLEVETTRSLRRQLTFLDRGDDRKALDLGAIHLCCEQCRNDYVEKSRAA